MDPMDKYLVIAKYLSIGSIRSIFFYITKNTDPSNPSDPLDPFFFI